MAVGTEVINTVPGLTRSIATGQEESTSLLELFDVLSLENSVDSELIWSLNSGSETINLIPLEFSTKETLHSSWIRAVEERFFWGLKVNSEDPRSPGVFPMQVDLGVEIFPSGLCSNSIGCLCEPLACTLAGASPELRD